MNPNFQEYLEQTSQIINKSEWDFTVTKEGNFTQAKITQKEDGNLINGSFIFKTKSTGHSKKSIEDMANRIIRLIENELD